MLVLWFSVAGFAALVVAYTLGIGGAVGAVIGLAVIVTGVVIQAAKPLVQRLTGS